MAVLVLFHGLDARGNPRGYGSFTLPFPRPNPTVIAGRG